MSSFLFKLFYSTLLLILISNVALAQPKIGIQAGLNLSNVMAKGEDGSKEATQYLPGLRLGLTADIRVTHHFFVQPGLFHTKKGFRQKSGGYYGMAENFKTSVSYFELPLNFLYKPNMGKGKTLLGAGPFVSYGTGGTWKSDNTILIGDIRTSNEGQTIFRKDVMDGEFGNYLYGRPWDYGINFLVGYEFCNRLSIQLNAQIGVPNLAPKVNGVQSVNSLRNRGFGFSAGYTL